MILKRGAGLMLKIFSTLLTLFLLSACASSPKYPRKTKYSDQLMAYDNLQPVCKSVEEKFATLAITKKKDSYPFLKNKKDIKTFREIIKSYPTMDEEFFRIRKTYYTELKASPVKLLDYVILMDKPCGLLTHYRLIRAFLETHLQYNINLSVNDIQILKNSMQSLLKNNQNLLGTMMVVGILSTDYYAEKLKVSDDDVLKMKILKKQVLFEANEFTQRFDSALKQFTNEEDKTKREKVNREEEIARYDSVPQETVDLVDQIYKDEYASASVYREQVLEVLNN